MEGRVFCGPVSGGGEAGVNKTAKRIKTRREVRLKTPTTEAPYEKTTQQVELTKNQHAKENAYARVRRE